MDEYLKCEYCERTEAPPYDVGDECWELCGGRFVLVKDGTQTQDEIKL